MTSRPEPIGVVDTVCVGGEGFIDIEIIDDSSETYNIFIDDVLKTPEPITDTDGVPIRFGPYADGNYAVVVEWIDLDDVIVDDVFQLDLRRAAGDRGRAARDDGTGPARPHPPRRAAASPRFTG